MHVIAPQFQHSKLKDKALKMLFRLSKQCVGALSRVGLQSRAMSTSGGNSLDLTGIYPPITTPFSADESVSYDKLKHNVDLWDKTPIRGYVVQGSNGEYVYLTDSERVDIVQNVRSLTTKLILAGSGCESTSATIAMTNKMAAAGADAALVVTPCYYKGRMTDAALKDHFRRVADEAKVPVILYSVPANTGLDLSVQVVVELSAHPNIIGMKDSGGDIVKIANIVRQTEGNNFQMIAGSASFLLPSLVMGAAGGVCALANALPSACCELQTLYQEGKLAEAKTLQQRLIDPNTAVTKQFGVSGLKAAMEWFGFYGGPVRSPLQPITEKEVTTLRKYFSDNKFL